MTLVLAFDNAGQWAIALGLIAVCVLLILVVLVQQASGGGLVGAFGGGGSGGAFGAKTGDVFTVITVALAGFYL
ncbi:MAG: preprotein translocase subunit SecG, partial [Planctomycetes bacterium]|nr:preprotein translocase subunit SecG [Planctomycetota bacterium]